jgi:hypothetical protein
VDLMIAAFLRATRTGNNSFITPAPVLRTA